MNDRGWQLLWVITNASFDGPGRVLATLLAEWPLQDRIVLCAIRRIAPEFRQAMPGGVSLVELDATGFWGTWRAAGFARLCRTFRPDLVHTHLSRADWIARPIARAFGVPVVSTIHNVHSRMYAADFPPPLGAIGRALDRLTAPCVDRFIAVSQGVSADLEQAGIRPERITVVPNALDHRRCGRVAARADVRRMWACADHDVVIGTVALLKPQKGIRFLVDAARLVVAREPRARFIHMGDGPLAAEIRACVDAAGLGDRFRLLGRVADSMSLLTGLDLFVLPSLWEGLPVALLEAMAVGLACVGTRIPGIDEVIEDGTNGLLVPPRDAAALADAIVTLAADPARRAALGTAAEARIRDHFSAAGMTAAYRRIYADVLTSRS